MKQAELETLELAAAAGETRLKYLDESGFGLWSPVSYCHALSGEQKRLEQTHQIYGTRLSVGLWEEGKGFEYGLVKGGFDRQRYIELMDWEAEKAAQTLAKTGQITVVVQDNGSIHKSKITRAQCERWETQGLMMFSATLLLGDKSN